MRKMFWVLLLLSLQTPTVSPEVVSTVPASTLGLYLALGLAGMTAMQIIVMAGITSWTTSRKEKRDAEREESKAKLQAELKSEEKKEDWRRQDEVAERAANTAKLLLESQNAAIKRQDQVADQVSIAAKQAASAASLLVEQQKVTNTRQDQVAELVATAAKQAKDAAALLVDAQASAAKQVADAASLLVTAQADTIKRTDEVARIAAEADARVQLQLVALDEQGKKIHTLVNSDMTAARTAERDSLKLLVISLKNALALSKNLGIMLSGNEDEEIARIEKRIEELNQIIADRHAAQKIVDDEAKAVISLAANSHPATMAATTEATLKEVANNTAEIAKNTAPEKKT